MTDDTIVLANGKNTHLRYKFSQMLDYCMIVGKEINELSKDEIKQFEIKGEDE